MNCSMNEYCKNIAEDYASRALTIKKEFAGITEDIDNTIDELKKLIVPEDYLGNQIIEKLKKIKPLLEDDVQNINNVKTKVVSYAESRQEEHWHHYENWLEKEREMEKAIREDN